METTEAAHADAIVADASAGTLLQDVVVAGTAVAATVAEVRRGTAEGPRLDNTVLRRQRIMSFCRCRGQAFHLARNFSPVVGVVTFYAC